MSTPRTVVTIRFEQEHKPFVFFREISLDGVLVVVETGRLDPTTGLIDTRERGGARLDSTAEAQQRFDALVADWKGFGPSTRREQQVTTPPQVLASAASNPSLEQNVRTSRDAAQVYADWLQTRDDPRGELAALRLAGNDAAADAFLAANDGRLLGELDVKLGTEVYDLTWHHGFLSGASLKRARHDRTAPGYEPTDTVLHDLTARFLALPLAQHLTDLRFGLASYDTENDWSPTLRAVAAAPQAPHLKSLRFDDYTSQDNELSWTGFGDFSGSLNVLRALEVFHLRSGGGGTLGAIDLPQLRSFVRESGGLAADELQELITAHWPALESLEVWFGRSDFGAEGTPAHVAQLLATLPAGVTHLGLVNCEFVHELVPMLAASPALARLRTLDLSKGALRDSDVDALLRERGAFKHLLKLNLDENQLDERVGELQTQLPQVTCAEQRDDDDDDARYAAVGE